MVFERIAYSQLNSRQKETYNFHKIASVLADYGFTCIRLSDDWEGADFIAQHIDGETFLKVQLKGRLSFDKKYLGKNLWISFLYENEVFLYQHDETLEQFSQAGRIVHTDSWQVRGQFHFPKLGQEVFDLIEGNRLKA